MSKHVPRQSNMDLTDSLIWLTAQLLQHFKTIKEGNMPQFSELHSI